MFSWLKEALALYVHNDNSNDTGLSYDVIV